MQEGGILIRDVIPWWVYEVEYVGVQSTRNLSC